MGLGSGIWKKPFPDPGSRGKKGTGSRMRIRNNAFLFFFLLNFYAFLSNFFFVSNQEGACGDF
jgi:hypothetical protein